MLCSIKRGDSTSITLKKLKSSGHKVSENKNTELHQNLQDISKGLVLGILASYPGIQQKLTKIHGNHFKSIFLAILGSGNFYKLLNVNVVRFAIVRRLHTDLLKK